MTTKGSRTIEGWTFLLTYGYDLDLYSQGDRRKAIDRGTGKEVLNYVVGGK